MTMPFLSRRRVEFCDTDMAGIVHFANFFRFMEAAETDFLRSLGMSVSMPWQNERIGFPRVAARCDYLKPARFQDVLDISVRVHNIGRKSVTYTFEFRRDTEVLARGEISTVCCRVAGDHALESIEIPPELRQRLEQAKGPAAAAE
jgi:acyl-CoA thioester hydrolase